MKAEAVSVQNAAILLGVHEDTIKRWGKQGYLRLVRVGPRLLRVPSAEIFRLRNLEAAQIRKTLQK